MKRGKKVLEKMNFKEFIKPTKKKVLLLSGVVALIIVIAALGNAGNKETIADAKDDIVMRGDIEVTITGSAAVEPYERFEIIPKVSGDIIYCPYNVGDMVHKDDILYNFDSSDSDLAVERQRISMKQSENSYKRALEESEKLQIKTDNSGVVSGLNIKVGEEVKAGTKIASVNDTTILEVELPFTQAQITKINVGDMASVTSSKHMSAVSGTVIHVSNTSYAGSDGTALYTVGIRFKNPGAFYAGMEVGGSVGDNISPGSGVVENNSSGEILSEINGTVARINCANGDYVSAGTVVATLISEDVSEKIEDSTLSYKSAQISMEQTEKGLEDYKITSPINGTVITKNAKAGDTIDKTNSTTTMMVVADISKLKFELAIDELDVKKVKEGLEVMISCDALPDETFIGVITNVSVEGVATNGVTTYSAEVEIPEPGNLRPSMNIDASIIVESASDVLMVPTADITTIGNRSYVFVKDASGKFDKKKTEEDAWKNGKTKTGGIPDNSKVPSKMKSPEGMSKNGEKQNFDRKSFIPEAPEGYVTVEIVTGIANEDFTEVKSGLTEGQEVYSKSAGTSSYSSMLPHMGAMGGGMMGGMPGGMGARPGGMR